MKEVSNTYCSTVIPILKHDDACWEGAITLDVKGEEKDV